MLPRLYGTPVNANARRSRRWLPAVIASLLAVSSGLAFPALLLPHRVSDSRVSATNPSAPNPAGSTSAGAGGSAQPAATFPYGNISLAAGLPKASLPSGSQLEMSYSFHVVKWPSGVSSIRVTFPSVQATFPLVGGGSASLWTQRLNFSLTDTSVQGGKVTIARHTIGPGGAAFASGTHAVLSSQLLAIMENVAWGVAPVDVQWHWWVQSSSGAVLTHGSSSTSTINPQPFVSIVSAGPAKLKPGQNYTVCVGGPLLSNRSLSLHMEVPNPYRAFAWSNTHIPANTKGSWCWKVQLPSNFSPVPSALLVHVWSYATQPGILYILHTKAV